MHKMDACFKLCNFLFYSLFFKENDKAYIVMIPSVSNVLLKSEDLCQTIEDRERKIQHYLILYSIVPWVFFSKNEEIYTKSNISLSY